MTKWCFSRIQVRRMPGILTGFTLDGLSEGVNIIHGPNGSGKTQTARAINTLLWPDKPVFSDSSVAGTAQAGTNRWVVDFEAGRALWQRDANDAPRPDMPPSTASSRYNLWLHDLLVTDNREFADAIRRESAGGTDLAAAMASIKLVERPPRHDRESHALEGAIQAVREATNVQSQLQQEEERQLKALLQQQQDATDAAARVMQLNRAIVHARGADAMRRAETALTAFPAGLGLLQGNELQLLMRIRERHQKETNQINEQRSLLQHATAESDACHLPDDGIAPQLVQSLENRCNTLEGFHQGLAATHVRQARAREALATARNTLHPHADPATDAKLATIDLGAIDNLAALANQMHSLQADQAAITALQDWLRQSERPGDTRRLREAVLLLARWLRTAVPAIDDHIRLRRVALVAATVVVVMSFVLMMAVHVAWILGVVAAAGIVAWAWHKPSTSEGSVASSVPQELVRLEVGQPTAWTPETVAAFLDQIIAQLEAATLEEERAARWAAQAPRRREVAQQLEALDRQRQKVVDQLGVAPGIGGMTLMMLVQNLDRWQHAQVDLVASDAECRTLEADYEAMRQMIESDLIGFGYDRLADPDAAKAAVVNLRTRLNAFGSAQERIDAARRQIETCENRIAAIATEESELFGRAGITPGDEATLRERVGLLDAYKQALDQHRRASDALAMAAAELHEEPALLTTPIDQLDRELATQQATGARLQDIARSIGVIQQKLAAAKESHDLETAIESDHAARSDLAQVREQDCELIAGWLLAQDAERRTRDDSLPKVFHRARELFLQVTRGRYKLELAGSHEPSFRASDTESGRAHPLEELSSGTRVQLLLAVRIAFVEESEGGIQLPLIIDEALANADEQRARAIIEALVLIAQRGRQIFYFTAQHDEVAKWKLITDTHPGLPIHVIDLASVRRMAMVEQFPLQPEPPGTRSIPEPGDMTRQQYGKKLQVPGFDAAEDRIGSTHLWHLVDDLTLLHSLLLMGIGTWGQLKSLASEGGSGILGTEGLEQLQHAIASGKAMEEIARRRRIGLGKHVTRQVIEEAHPGPAFVDRIVSLAGECSGNSKALLNMLEDGRVSRFGGERVRNLREFLENEGYYDARPPMDVEQIRIGTMAACAADLGSGKLDPKKIDEFIAASAEREGDNDLAATPRDA